MSNLTISSMLSPARKIAMMVDETTEPMIYAYDSSIFLTYSPEWVFIRREMLLNETRRHDALVNVVNRAIAALPTAQRTIIRLRYFNDGTDAYTAKAIAGKLGISVRTYYNYLNEAKKILRTQLEKDPTVIEYFTTGLDN